VHCPNLKRNLLFSFLVVLAACAAPRLTAAPEAPEIANARYSVRLVKAEQGTCSAVVVAPGLALTAEHCRMLIQEGTVDGLRAAAMTQIGNSDAAFVRVPELACPCAPIASHRAELNDTVVVIGFPMGTPRVLSWGVIAEPDPEYPGTTRVSAAVIGGMSGGGVFNSDGRLVGVTSMGAGAFPIMLYVEVKPW
jgi:S1-C subfamily serine protease